MADYGDSNPENSREVGLTRSANGAAGVHLGLKFAE
jgi:hypothetical protein